MRIQFPTPPTAKHQEAVLTGPSREAESIHIRRRASPRTPDTLTVSQHKWDVWSLKVFSMIHIHSRTPIRKFFSRIHKQVWVSALSSIKAAHNSRALAMSQALLLGPCNPLTHLIPQIALLLSPLYIYRKSKREVKWLAQSHIANKQQGRDINARTDARTPTTTATWGRDYCVLIPVHLFYVLDMILNYISPASCVWLEFNQQRRWSAAYASSSLAHQNFPESPFPVPLFPWVLTPMKSLQQRILRPPAMGEGSQKKQRGQKESGSLSHCVEHNLSLHPQNQLDFMSVINQFLLH